MRIEETCESSDKVSQFHIKHLEPSLKNNVKTFIPHEDFVDDETGEHLKVIGVRVFHGGAQAVINTVAYYYYYGYVRCNLAQDSHLAEGVYAYIDIAKALKDIDTRDSNDRTKCLGLVAGYLRKTDNSKGRMCLDSRSCELLAVFSPCCTVIDLPFKLGAEDALAFRLPPEYLGAPLRWYRMLSNLTSDQVQSKETILSKVNEGNWRHSLPQHLLKECYEVVRYNAQSKNEEDMYEQKDLWIKMHEATRGYDVSGFRTKALSHESFQHDKDEFGRGVTHKCMVYLQKASDPVDVRKGEWRLWDAPQAVRRAKDIYEEQHGIKLSQDITLTPAPGQPSVESRATYVMSSTCAMSSSGGVKRTKVPPASPESIAKSARTLWNTNRDRMRAQ